MTHTLLERAASVAAVGIGAVVEHSTLAPDLRPPVKLYLLANGCGFQGATVARVAGCSKQNVSKHLARVEAAREDPAFDDELARLEAKLFGEAWP